MRIFRATNTAVIKYIEPHIRPADGVSKEQYLVNLAAWLVGAPETLFLQVVFNDLNELTGLMVAYLPPGVEFVFISQVWAEDKATATDLLTRVSSWADANSRTQLRMETESDHDRYSDAWGFKTITETRGILLTDLYGSPTYESGQDDRGSGESTAELPPDSPSTDPQVRTKGIPEGDLDAQGNVRDRTPTQNGALERNLQGSSTSADGRSADPA